MAKFKIAFKTQDTAIVAADSRELAIETFNEKFPAKEIVSVQRINPLDNNDLVMKVRNCSDEGNSIFGLPFVDPTVQEFIQYVEECSQFKIQTKDDLNEYIKKYNLKLINPKDPTYNQLTKEMYSLYIEDVLVKTSFSLNEIKKIAINETRNWKIYASIINIDDLTSDELEWRQKDPLKMDLWETHYLLIDSQNYFTRFVLTSSYGEEKTGTPKGYWMADFVTLDEVKMIFKDAIVDLYRRENPNTELSMYDLEKMFTNIFIKANNDHLRGNDPGTMFYDYDFHLYQYPVKNRIRYAVYDKEDKEIFSSYRENESLIYCHQDSSANYGVEEKGYSYFEDQFHRTESVRTFFDRTNLSGEE